MGENFDNRERKEESPKDQREKLFKESLETALNGGVEIIDENSFERLKKLLKTHYNLNIDNIKFNDLNNGIGIFIKQKGNGRFFVYNLNNQELLGTNLVELGVIENNNFDKTNLFISLLSSRERRQKGIEYKIPEEPQIDSIQVVTENKIQLKPEQETKVETTDKTYIIKKGDYLWKIISEQYGLKRESDKNAIWQIMEMLRKDPRNKNAIKDIDTIFVKEKLYLPKEIEIKQGKTNKKINLI